MRREQEARDAEDKLRMMEKQERERQEREKEEEEERIRLQEEGNMFHGFSTTV